MCAIFFSYQGKRIHNHIYFFYFKNFTYYHFCGDFFSKYEFQLLVMFIFAQIWNNYRVGTGYINRQIFTIHIFLHFILAYFYEDKELFFWI